MRVRMLTPGFYPALGGAEKQALELSKALAGDGVSIEVLTRRLPGLSARETVEGIPVVRVAAPGTGLINALVFFTGAVWRLWRDADDYDVVHVHLGGSPALAACFAGALTGRKVVAKIGGGRGIGEIAVSSRSFSGRLKLTLLRVFQPRLVAVCEDLKAELVEHGFSESSSVIPNGVDLEIYRPADPSEKARLRREFGWPEGTLFVYTGRFSPEKQLPRFARAFREAARGLASPARLVMIGEGSEAERIREAGGEAVLLEPSTDAVAARVRAADVFVLPSVSEGLSNALLEAMGSGLAICASAVGGTKEAVPDGEAGLLFDFDDDAAMGEAASRYLREPSLAVRHGVAARRIAEARFAMRAVARRYRELYEALGA
ncbi:MAG: hypothetical protein AUJ52_13900 [Elusimicrobia bacterium CG1_02_63_36]|nr:MAG: hypothetical protein AUJ52_13900 [Elusimicrobia bacterium CG1_02_63_36]